MEILAESAKQKKISKNKVAETAIKKFFEKEIKNELRRSFMLVENDKELIEMAEWGLEDYASRLEKMYE
jgi:hypothetical protein